MTIMKKMICIFIGLLSFMTYSQTPDQIVQQQLEAYNLRDIDAFMEVFHGDIELWTLGENSPSKEGWDNVKSAYLELFENSPTLNSQVLNRTVIGNRVIDYERISGRKGASEEIFLVMIYEVKDGKIWKAWALRE
jgi:hypothetical protein